MDIYKSLLGHEGKDVEPLVQSAKKIYQYLFGERIKPETPDRASIWTDTNVYNELGIPAIKIGPRGRCISARNEEIEIDAMVRAAQLYALMALDICSRERPRGLGERDTGDSIATENSPPIATSVGANLPSLEKFRSSVCRSRI